MRVSMLAWPARTQCAAATGSERPPQLAEAAARSGRRMTDTPFVTFFPPRMTSVPVAAAVDTKAAAAACGNECQLGSAAPTRLSQHLLRNLS